MISPDTHARFAFADISELEQALAGLGVELSLNEDTSPLARPTVMPSPNSMCIQPMEGCDAEPDGSPGELTLRRYRRFAEGGAGIIWVEACAVSLGCRANPRQLCLTNDNRAAFEALVTNIRRWAGGALGVSHKPFLVLQITHSGRYTRPGDKPAPVIAFHDPILDPTRGITQDYPVVSDEELERIEDDFEAAAKLAFEAGFDAVDVKSCHRYLVSELLAAHTRPGRYGGSYENRTRFLRNVVRRVTALGGITACRLNAFDAHPYPYGWGTDRENPSVPDLAEPARLAEELAGWGVRLLNVTAGNPYFSPHVNRPYDRNVQGNAIYPQHPLVGVSNLLKCARQVRQAAGVPVVGSGFSWLRHLWPAAASAGVREGWFDIAGLGREAFAFPGFAREIVETGRIDPRRCCIACSRCSELMRAGKPAGCVPFDADIYARLYREIGG